MPFLHRALELRPFDHADAQALANAVRGSQEHLGQFLPWARGPYTAADAETWIEGSLRQWAENRGFHWGIFSTDQVLGSVGFHPIQWDIRSASIGYWMVQEAGQQGMMTHAAARLLTYGFRRYGLYEVWIEALEDNVRSRALAERLGFAERGHRTNAEGRLVRYRMTHDMWGEVSRIVIRTASPAEIPAHLLEAADPEWESQDYWKDPSLRAWVAVGTGRIVGEVLAVPRAGGSMEIVNFAVDPWLSGGGEGRRLLEAAVHAIENEGIAEIFVATGTSSLAALSVYQQCGFRVVELERDYFSAHYPEPIIENGIPCIDRVILRRVTSPPDRSLMK